MLGVVLGVMLKLWSDTDRRIDHLEVSLRAEMRAMRDELKGDIAAVREELKGDLAAVREELHREIGAVRTDTTASIERLSDRQHADANAVNARLDVLLLARGSLAETPEADPVSSEQQPATAAETAPAYRVPSRDAGDSDRP